MTLGNALDKIEGVMVGAAAPTCGCNKKMPTLTDANVIDLLDGIPVDRAAKNLDKAGCPMSIHTKTSMEVEHKSLVPFDVATPTGAAAPLISAFDDVPDGYWASCDINKLAQSDVVAGYPDGRFKPNTMVSRAEFATMMLKGLNMGDSMIAPQHKFSDVPKNNQWLCQGGAEVSA